MKKFISIVVIVFCCITSINGQTVPSYLPTTGLVGWWPFNGNAIDESINTNDGTVSGATLTTDRFGITNNAYSTSAGYISCGNLNIPTSSTLTISFWYKSLTDFGIGEAICLGSNSSTTWGCVIGNSFFAQNYGRGCGSTGSGSAAISIVYSTWHHVVFVSNGLNNTTKIYHDGNFISTAINANSSSGCSNSQLFFGTDIYSSIELFNGSLDDIGIWNRNLTPCEIQQLYTSSLNTFTFAAVSSSSIICKGQSATLIASGASSYTWQPSSVVSNTSTVTPLANSIYTVVATNTAGCISTRTISITVKPTPTIAVSSGTICKGQSFTITPSGASTYTYSSGSSVVSPTLTTSYSVTGTNTLGCVSTSPTTLTVFVSPCTGIDELENNQSIVFYPNPFTNEIYVKVEGEIKNKKYLIYTASGQVIQTGILNANKINCSDFSKGLYFIKLEGSAKAFRLVKEN